MDVTVSDLSVMHFVDSLVSMTGTQYDLMRAPNGGAIVRQNVAGFEIDYYQTCSEINAAWTTIWRAIRGTV